MSDVDPRWHESFFDDDWLAENKLTWKAQPAHSLGDLLRTRGQRQLVTISPDATAAAAIEMLQSVDISQLPVMADGKPVGSVQEVTLARVLHDNSDPEKVTISEIMAKPLPQLDVTVHLDEAYRLLLAGNTGVLAVANGKIVDIVTRIDLIEYWTHNRQKS